MEKKVTGEALCLLILLILFAKNAVNFFIEGGVFQVRYTTPPLPSSNGPPP